MNISTHKNISNLAQLKRVIDKLASDMGSAAFTVLVEDGARISLTETKLTDGSKVYGLTIKAEV